MTTEQIDLIVSRIPTITPDDMRLLEVLPAADIRCRKRYYGKNSPSDPNVADVTITGNFGILLLQTKVKYVAKARPFRATHSHRRHPLLKCFLSMVEHADAAHWRKHPDEFAVIVGALEAIRND